MLRTKVIGLGRARALGMALVILAAAALLTRPAAATPANAGVCTFNLTENWSPAITSTPAVNPHWWLTTPVSANCTGAFNTQMTIGIANGFADAASCSTLVDLLGEFAIAVQNDGNYQSGPLVSVAGGGTLATQEWVFDSDPEYRFATSGTLRMNNPQADLQRCATSGLSTISMTGTFLFVDQSEL